MKATTTSRVTNYINGKDSALAEQSNKMARSVKGPFKSGFYFEGNLLKLIKEET